MWTLDSDQIIDMVNSAHGRLPLETPRRRKMLEAGLVVGEIFWHGMPVEKKDIFTLNQLTFSGQAGFVFRYWKTATWFCLAALPLNGGSGLMNSTGIHVPENTILDVSDGRVAILLKHEGEWPILVTLTRTDVINEAMKNPSFRVVKNDGFGLFHPTGHTEILQGLQVMAH